MVTPHSWHPGSGCLNARWAAPVPLLPDELLSSWLARAALAQGCDPLVLTGDVWTGWRVWTMDPDRGLQRERLETLATVSGITVRAFDAAALRPFLVSVFGEPAESRPVLPWMLTAGSRNRVRHGGLQFCSACLAEDRHPYYRQAWRLAWHTTCHRHGVELLDCCPSCHAPIQPHRLLATDRHLAVCAICRADLRLATTTLARADALVFQTDADAAVATGTAHYGNLNLTVAEWFGLVRHLVQILHRVSEGKATGLSAMLKELGVDASTLEPTSTGLQFEMLPTAERAALLGPTLRLLGAGPDRLLAAAKEAGVSKQGLMAGGRSLPPVLESLANQLPSRSRASKKPSLSLTPAPRSRQSVMRMWARLLRRMQAESR